MMISPEGFYELRLKGRTVAEIKTVIRGLKQEIGRLKNIMEHPDYAMRGEVVHPDESTRLWCGRQYLERAKEALVEAGGSYTPSQAELKAAEFDNNIPFIEKVLFSIGGYFDGFETKTVILNKENMSLIVEHSKELNPPKPDDKSSCLKSKEEFLDGFRELHIGEWRRRYNLYRFGYEIMDGTQWALEIYYCNGCKPVKIYGDNAYPYNFSELEELFEMEAK